MTAPTTEAPAEQTEPAYVERWGAHRAADLLAELSGSQVWSGIHFLTGERAGEVEGPVLRAGAVVPEEAGTPQRLIRAMVGLR